MSGELWTEQEVSEKYGIEINTLRYWRKQRAVLPFRKLGRMVRYVPAEVEAAIEASKVDVGGDD